MYRRQLILAGLSASLLAAQHHDPAPRATTGVMSNEVIEARLKQLGYSEVKVKKQNTLRYEIQARKDGKAVVLELHPQLGLMKDKASGASTLLMHLAKEPSDPKKP